MRTGCPDGRNGSMRLGIGLFVGEDGYTSVAVATALLACVALTLCVATAEWTLSRSADIQQVTDATSLAGSNVVASFTTAAQALDASVLTLGLTGTAMFGVGLVMSAIPGTQEAADKVLESAHNVLDARNDFARSAAQGLRHAEDLLPAVIVANSWACARANDAGGVEYAGVSIPLPLESQSDYGGLADAVSDEGADEVAQRLQEATRETEDAKRRADDARRRAWQADCVDMPRCMRSRAQTLAGLTPDVNPMVGSPEAWNFGVAIQRCRAYYAARLAREAPLSQDIEEVTDSLARKAFYEYAVEEVNGAWYTEYEDGSVDLSVPHLARNSNEMRETWLYTDAAWPCTYEGEECVLHSTLLCPGATGEFAGFDCVAAIDGGSVRRCSECGMDVADLGKVASISTSADNGYEHYWQIVVEEAKNYESARNEQAEAERRAKGVAEEGERSFDKILEQLRVPRPRICPPGAWGCVALVARKGGVSAPSELTSAFLEGTRLPAGTSVSASTLATDEHTKHNNVLSHFFDGLSSGENFGIGSVLQGITGLWGSLMVSYGSAYDDLGEKLGQHLERVDGVFGGSVGSWLQRRLASVVRGLGIQPADMRLRKPVLTSTQNVLGQAGIDARGRIRQLVQSLPSEGSALDVAHALGLWVWDDVRGRVLEVARLPVPGTGLFVPLSMDLGAM